MFFSFPHIGIDSKGVVGNISRPGRAGMSCACGAVIKSLSDFKSEGLTCNCKEPGGVLILRIYVFVPWHVGVASRCMAERQCMALLRRVRGRRWLQCMA